MDISREYEIKQILNNKKISKKIKNAYIKLIDKIFAIAYTAKLVGNNFDISKNPVLDNQLNQLLSEFSKELDLVLVNGIRSQWEISLEKNLSIVSALYKGKIVDDINTIIIDQHAKALVEYLKTINNKKGLNLSDRIWHYGNQFRSEIEQGLYVGLSNGYSAAKMAIEQKKYLVEPDKLFRRVRDAKGDLILSSRAKEYNPGKGVYRSSFKNALRMTRTVTNNAYRSSDHETWHSTPFILGIEVKLSNNHPTYDICDMLVGKYPASYKHTGFHPQCLCYAIPILANEKDFEKYQQSVLDGTDDDFNFSDQISTIPAGAKTWFKENKAKLKSQKSLPFFIKDNRSYFK